MNQRIWLSIAGLVVIAISFFILFEYPADADEAFYLLLIWMVVNFVLLYSLRARGPPRPTDAPRETSPFPSTPLATAPLPSSSGFADSSASSGSSGSSGSIGFCIYCAAPISPGTRACPACGHVLPQW